MRAKHNLPRWKALAYGFHHGNDPTAQETLKEAERAAAAVYIDYPPTPKWYPPAVGAWLAAMVVTCSHIVERSLKWSAALVVLLALEAAFFCWYRRYRGTWPTLTDVPAEIGRAMSRYAVGLAVLVAAIVGVGLIGGLPAAAAVAFVGTTAGLHAYERTYARAAEAARERLA